MRCLLLLPVLLTTLWAAPPPLRVLFIGNSLTAANELPKLVEAIGKANGRRIDTVTIAHPNYSLEDHWNNGEARHVIARGKWDFVVLQQGPSSLPESRALLIDYARRFSGEAAQGRRQDRPVHGWPSTARAGDYDGVKLSYETAAKEVGGHLPAHRRGLARRLAAGSGSEFYGPDGFHPSPLGSLLAALVDLSGASPANRRRGLLPGVVPVAESATLLIRRGASPRSATVTCTPSVRTKNPDPRPVPFSQLPVGCIQRSPIDLRQCDVCGIVRRKVVP